MALIGTGLLGLMAAFAIAFLVIGIILYVYLALALMAMAKKTGTPNGWLGFIPIANIYLMTAIAGIPWWWLIVSFLPFVGIIAVVYILWKIAERLGKPGWWGILIVVIPIVNLVLIGILAWGPAKVAKKK